MSGIIDFIINHGGAIADAIILLLIAIRGKQVNRKVRDLHIVIRRSLEQKAK